MRPGSFNLLATAIPLCMLTGASILANAQDQTAYRKEVVVVAPNTRPAEGEKYSAEIFVANIDTAAQVDMEINGLHRKTAGGKGIYEGMAEPGTHTWSGMLRITPPGGTVDEYKIPLQTYTVTTQLSAVMPEKMNVLYIGIDNPVEISTTQCTNDKMHVSISDGSISGKKGRYNAVVVKPGIVEVEISCPVEEGQYRKVAAASFRAKRIPTPHAKFVGRGGGKMSVAAMRSQHTLFANVEDFDFYAKFTIDHFTLSTLSSSGISKQATASSGELTPEMVAALAAITPGSYVLFSEITATGPDGVKRQVDPIVFEAE